MPDAKTVEVYDVDASLGSANVSGAGTWSKSVTLSAGSHGMKAKSTDTAGNVSGFSTTINLLSGSSTVPSIPDLLDDSGSSSSDNITNDSTPRIQLTTVLAGPNSVMPPDASLVTLEMERKTGSGAWGNVMSLPYGSLTITSSGSTKTWKGTLQESSALSNAIHSYRGRWKDGQSAYSSYSATLAITVDTTAPSAPAITSHSNGYVYTGTAFTISGTAS